MKKITIFIGSWVEDMTKKVGFFNYLEKKMKCKIRKKSDFVFQTRLDDKEITFQFCFGPANDIIYQTRKSLKKELPPSVGHLATQRIEADEIYYLGFCGVFKGDKGEIFLPVNFKKVTFKDYMLNYNHVKTMKISKAISCENILAGKIKGRPCTLITSNQVLSLRYTFNNSPEILKAISLELKKHADIVEMENYGLIKKFGKTHPVGVFLYGTDKPLDKTKMLGGKGIGSISGDFNKKAIKLIEFIRGNT